MKKSLFLFFTFVFFILFSCSEKDEISLSNEKSITSYLLRADINDLESDVTGKIDNTFHTIILDKEIPFDRPLIASFTSTGEVYLNGTLQESGKTANTYTEKMSLQVLAEDGTTALYELTCAAVTQDEFSDYRIEASLNGEMVVLKGSYNVYDNIITIVPRTSSGYPWIDNMDQIIASFKSDGKVYVGEELQESGVTVNDFRENPVYKVIMEDGRESEYTVVLKSPQTSGIPVIKIDTEGGQEITDKKNYINASFLLDDREHPEFFVDSETTIRGRGNTTWDYPKKPYRLKFDKKTSLFGLGKAKSWVLLANYLDPTFITAHIAFELGHRLGVPYTNHAFHVELYMNGYHQGNYVLTEQVQVNEFRVNIDEDEDIFIELDSYFDEDYKFKSAYIDLPVNVKSPEFTDESQMDFVIEAFNGFMASLFDNASGFPTNDYKEWIDIDILIDYLLVNEIVGNGELHWPKSTYMSKTRTGKFIMGPLWDFDWAYGYTGGNFDYFHNVENLLFSSTPPDDRPGSVFFARFFEDPEFITSYQKRWNEVKPWVINIHNYVDELGEKISKSADFNRELWDAPSTGFTYQINAMKNYLTNRINALDRKIKEL